MYCPKNPTTRFNFTKSYYTLTNSDNTLCVVKHDILGPEYTEKLIAYWGFVPQTPYRGSPLDPAWELPSPSLVPPMSGINHRHWGQHR